MEPEVITQLFSILTDFRWPAAAVALAVILRPLWMFLIDIAKGFLGKNNLSSVTSDVAKQLENNHFSDYPKKFDSIEKDFKQVRRDISDLKSGLSNVEGQLSRMNGNH